MGCHPVRVVIEVGRTKMSLSSWSWLVDPVRLHLCGDRMYLPPSERIYTNEFHNDRSTHNTQIERLWVEVGSQFAQRWWAFFFWLGHLHWLDHKNPHHLWLLHFLFLEMINADCKKFQADWNAHPILGVAKDQSPNVWTYVPAHVVIWINYILWIHRTCVSWGCQNMVFTLTIVLVYTLKS